MAMTLQQMKTLYPEDPMRQGLIEKFLDGSESRVLPRLNFVDASDALGYNWLIEDSLGNVAERSLNQDYAASAGKQSPGRETLSIFGGAIRTDQIFIDAKGESVRTNNIARRMIAAGKLFDKRFFHGDPQVAGQSAQFMGLRARSVLKSRVSWAGANGGQITQDLLDEALDRVSGDNGSKVIFCSRDIRRKITSLVRTAAGGKGLADSQTQLQTYNGSEIVTVTEDEGYNPIFAFNETRGSSNVTSSLYVVRFGGSTDEEHVQGIRGPSFMVARPPVNMGTYVLDVIDNVLGIADFSPHCFWRIGGLLA